MIIEIIQQIEIMENLRRKEREILEKIAELSNVNFAIMAAECFDSRKHQYTFEGYLSHLEQLSSLLEKGIDKQVALELTEICADGANKLFY